MRIKVKIALAVAPDGSWNSCGFSEGDEDDMMGLATETLSNGERRYWLTAEVDAPEVTEVAASASVVKDQEGR